MDGRLFQDFLLYIGWQLFTVNDIRIKNREKLQRQLERCDNSARSGDFGSARLCFREPLPVEQQKVPTAEDAQNVEQKERKLSVDPIEHYESAVAHSR